MEKGISSARKKKVGKNYMYKEVIISIVIIVLILVASTVSQNYTDKAIEKIDSDLSTLKEKIMYDIENNEDKDEKFIKKEIEKILEEWEEKYYTLAIYIEHDELEKVKKELITLKSNIEIKEYEEAVVAIDGGIFSLKHLKEKEILNLDNFF